MNYTIRTGTASDCAAALTLIKELAEYEKAPNEVAVSLEEFTQDGFGPNAIYELLVAEKNNTIVGIALFYTKYSTWKGKCIYLEDLVVTETERANGIGAKLFEAVMRVAQQRKARRMEWQVLEWNQPAINFYSKYKAVLDSEWINGKFTFEQLQAAEL